MRTAPSSNDHHSEIWNFCPITSFLASPPVLIHQAATHKADADASVIFLDLQPFSKVRRRKFKSTTLRITSFGQKLAPSHHPPTISSHHQTCANLISPVLRPLGSLWGGSQTQKANLYSFAHLVCSCLLSLVWDRLLAIRRQTLVHAGLHQKNQD